MRASHTLLKYTYVNIFFIFHIFSTHTTTPRAHASRRGHNSAYCDQIRSRRSVGSFSFCVPPPEKSVKQEFMAYLQELLNPYGDAVIKWARPDFFPVKPPTAGWPMTDFSTAAIIASAYLIFVLVGRTLMPYFPAVPGLYPLKFSYNIAQVMLCSYMCIESGVRAYAAGYTLLPCNAFNHTNPPIAFILYVFYLSKILDFMDTFFIIAEKRWKQLSFLHVYHHLSIFLFYWLNVNVAYDGDVYLTILLNGFIHTVMYNYYFVSLHSKDIWWKSALTSLQLVQFVVMNAQALFLLFTGCKEFPRNITIAYGYYILSMLLLFTHFFIVSYGFKKSKKPRKERKDE